MAAAKKANALEDVVLVAGTQQSLRNLYSLDIYGIASPKVAKASKEIRKAISLTYLSTNFDNVNEPLS
jgi:hypothetical protein